MPTDAQVFMNEFYDTTLTKREAMVEKWIVAVRADRDIAQSACAAWQDVFKSIEAHLQDRVAMRDAASPETYLSIIRNLVERIDKDSQAIVRSRWHDYAAQRQQIERLEQELADERRGSSLSQAHSNPERKSDGDL